MKKRQKRLASLLLACMMTALPASQVMAEIAFEASAGISEQLLFPKDSLTGVATGVAVDGQEASLEEGGIWKNTDENAVYSAQSDENGIIQIVKAGYVLTVEGGVSSKEDESRETPDHHYQFQDWEIPETTKDIAAYEKDETVKIKADEPDEGMVFSGWTSDTEGVSFADPASAETTLKMLDKKVTVKATYEPAPVEEVPAEEAPAEEVPAEEAPAEEVPVEELPNDSADASQGEVIVIGEEPAAPAETVEEVPAAQYAVTTNNGSGAGAYTEGAWVSIAANDRTAENLAFAGWSVDTQNVTLDDAYSAMTGFVMPAGEVVLTATYTEIIQEPTEFTVTINNGTGSGVYSKDAWVMISANDRTEEGLEFNGWFVDSMNVELEDINAAATGFSMPETDVTVSAQYKEIEVQQEEPVIGAPSEDVLTDTDTSVEEETAAPAETPAEEETAAPAETPTEEETAAPAETPTEEETAAPAETPTEEETAAPAETPAEEETAAQSEVIEIETSAPVLEPIEIETSVPEESEQVQSEEPVTIYEVVVENGIGSGEYAAGDIVTVEAEELEGMVFVAWTSSNPNVIMSDPSQEVASFTMPEEGVTVSATFEEAVYTVDITNGSFKADGSAEPKEFKAGDIVEIVADTPEEGYEFSNWEGMINGEPADVAFADAGQAETSFTMTDANVSVTAVYVPKEITYTITVANGLINGTSDVMELPEGTEFVVTPNEAPYNQAFARWEINGGEYESDDIYNEKMTLTADEDMMICAVYEGIQYTVTVDNGYSDYDECVVGTKVTIEADEAPAGYEFDYWYVDTENVALNDAYSERTSFYMPDGDVAVTAHYRQVEYQLTVENGYADQEYYYAGDTVTIYSNYPASGREFCQWAAVSGNATFADSSRWKTTFTMPASNVVVKATYQYGPSTDDNLILDIVAGGEYYAGDTIKFTASGAGMSNSNPNPGDYRYRPSGYQISNVTGTWQGSPYTTSMAINATGEYTLKVIFNKDIYDGTNWVSDGTSDAKSVTFKVINKAAGVATGDETPLAMVIAIAAISCVLFVILLIMFLKKKKNR